MAKQSKKKRNPNELAFYKRYQNESRYSKNRKKDLEKHLEKHPNDKQAKEGVRTIFEYRRNSHGKTQIFKDPKDVYRLNKFKHNKPYPEQKKTNKAKTRLTVGKSLREQLEPYVGIFA